MNSRQRALHLFFPNRQALNAFAVGAGRILWVVCAGILVCVCGCRSGTPGELLIGMELNYPPFEMIDSQGRPAGLSVEIAKSLGQFLGRDVHIDNIPFDGLIPALKTGKIDLIISSMTETPQRLESIDFSDPYLRTGLCLLLNKRTRIDSIEQVDQEGQTVAVKQGTTGQAYAQNHFKHARVLTLDKEDACVLEVIQGKAEGFIYDQMSVFKHWQQHQDS